MKRNVLVLIAFILLITSLISSYCFAKEMIDGVTKAFNPKTGKLILQTSQGEATFYFSKMVDVYVKPRRSQAEESKTWKFLLDNLFKGTKVKIQISDKLVTKIVIVEVPQ